MIGATYSDGQDDESYTYDLNGNRTNPGYVTGPDNQLLSDGTYWYTYDADGNRTSRFVWTDADADEESDITQYAWDNRNRLVQVTDRATLDGPATQIVTNYYDAENRWIGRAVDPDGETGTAAIQITTFAYAGNQIILQFDGTREDEGGSGPSAPLTASNLSHHYLWGPAVDQLLADEQLQEDASGYDLTTPGNVVWPLTDQLGSVRDLAVCENGVTSVANHRAFDSYGNLRSQTNAAVDCIFRFTGRAFDEVTGLQDNGNRKYDPTVARWLSEDPSVLYGRDANLSRYCGNSPTNGTDPIGLVPDGLMVELKRQMDRPLPGSPRPARTDDEKHLIQLCNGNAELIRKAEILFGILDKTEVNWGTDRCHNWCILFLEYYNALPLGDLFNMSYEMPWCNIWWAPLYETHGVITFQVNGTKVYLDRALQGGSDHIAFEPRPNLIYKGDPRWVPDYPMNRARKIMDALPSPSNGHLPLFP